MSDVGYTSVSMSFAGNDDDGLVSSIFGAWVNFDAYVPLIGRVDLYEKGLQLDTGKVFTPEIGTIVSGSGSYAVAAVGVDAWIAGASMDFDIKQTDLCTPNSTDGTLLYGLNGSMETKIVDFSLMTDTYEIQCVFDFGRCRRWEFSLHPRTHHHAPVGKRPARACWFQKKI